MNGNAYTSQPSCALILSGSMGKGHDSVAEACFATLSKSYAHVEILDCLKLLGRSRAAISETVYRMLLAVPTVYDGFYFSHIRSNSVFTGFLERASAKSLLPHLNRKILNTNPDLIVSVFPTGAGALGKLRNNFPNIPMVVIATDATVHAMWIHDGIDRYIVGSELAAGTLRQHRPRADVVVLPPPVRPVFYAAPEREKARQALGIKIRDGGMRCILVMAGGWGLGKLDKITAMLAEEGFTVLAVAGTNRKLYRRLVTLSNRWNVNDGQKIIPFKYTNRIPELMAASDIVVTSPGQTCHEARVIGRPLVLLDTVPGHGRENLLLELERGNALACKNSPKSVIDTIHATIDGVAGKISPWPISEQIQWDELFLKAIADLNIKK